jgi:hydrogenase nickel incorporation protein HypB
MCGICGCAEHVPDEREHHAHEHAHEHGQHEHAHGSLVAVERSLLDKNERFARANRRAFDARGIVAMNLMSSPGAGKTTLLERTIARLRDVPVHVIEGDQATERDAERIRAAGAKAVQINTGAGCHLDAHQVAHAVEALALPPGALVLIENVGNLVCPALFALGEHEKIVVFSVTEGEDKPLKYPHMFRAADVLVLNKIDLLPHVDFDVERSLEYARRLRPDVRVFQLSATRGDGMDAWCDWLRSRLHAAAAPPPPRALAPEQGAE